MKKTIIFFALRSGVALFLALQVWVWVRWAGIIDTGNWADFFGAYLRSVSPLKTSVLPFLVLVIPVIAGGYALAEKLSGWVFVLVCAWLGLGMSLCVAFFTFPRFAIFMMRVWVYVLAGLVSGAAYGLVMGFLWPLPAGETAEPSSFRLRRRLIGSIGLLAGGTSLLGSLSGPFYFWKNQYKYVEANISALEEGELMVVRVGGKPVWVLRRSKRVIDMLNEETEQLLDPDSDYSQQPPNTRNNLRSIRPEYFVAIGYCTHLGCSPRHIRENDKAFPGRSNQFFCPCHDGVFDLAGRVHRGTPPPVNMEIPVHEFVSDDVIRIYYSTLREEWG